MKHLCVLLVFWFGLVAPAVAEALVPVRTIRPKSIIYESDLVLKNIIARGAISSLDDIIGQEARIALYAGRPIRPQDVGPAALIERNQIVQLIYSGNVLKITTEGRALDRAAIGDRIRVMNLSSKTTVFGTISEDGTVIIE